MEDEREAAFGLCLCRAVRCSCRDEAAQAQDAEDQIQGCISLSPPAHPDYWVLSHALYNRIIAQKRSV